jgi:predicted esterase
VTFSDAVADVFVFYDERRYADALAVVARARARFPHEDATLTFWEACLLAMDGSPERALDTLRRGLDRELWWSAATLSDTDLDSVRRLDGWESMLAESDERSVRASSRRPDPMRRPGRTEAVAGVLITLHGANADVAAHWDTWAAAVPESWTVVAPVGSVNAMVDRWSWPMDASDAVDAALGQAPEIDGAPPVVLAGFSQGARVALDVAKAVESPPRGLILFGPALRPDALPPIPDVATFVHVGDRDWALAGVEAVAEELGRRGVPIQVERVPDLGHVIPTDLQTVVGRALAWITAVSG